MIEIVIVDTGTKTRDSQSVFEFDPTHGAIHRQMVATVRESRAWPLVGNRTFNRARRAGARPPRVSGAFRIFADQICRQRPRGFGSAQLDGARRLEAGVIFTIPPIDAAEILIADLPLRPAGSAGVGIVRSPIIQKVRTTPNRTGIGRCRIQVNLFGQTGFRRADGGLVESLGNGGN